MTGTVLDDLHHFAQRAWWALLLRGLLALAVGVFILVRPLESIAAFALVIAWWAMFTGFVNAVQAFELKRVARHWWVLLLSGLVSIGFGILALMYYPGLSLAFAVFVAVWWLMVTGVIEFYAALQMKKIGAPWGWTGAFGVLSVVASVFGLLSPPATLVAIMGLMAWFGIVVGLTLIIGAFRVRSIVKP